MTDWLKMMAMFFYAPMRGLREVRDRGRLGPAVLTAFVVQVASSSLMELLAGNHALLKPSPGMLSSLMFRGVAPILTIAIIIVPVVTLIANLFDRRGSFGIVLQQEYGSLASVCFYVLSGVYLVSLICAAFLHFTGIQAAYVTSVIQSQDTEQMRAMIQMFPLTPEQVALLKQQMRDPVYNSNNHLM